MQLSQFPDNERLTDRLRDEIREDRMPHGKLFHGRPGDGKLAIALAYAHAILCTNRTEDGACGTCPACSKTSKLIHPDLHFSFPVITKKSSDQPVSEDYLAEGREAVLGNVHLSLNDWLMTINAENKQGNITARECRQIIQKLSLKPYESQHRILLMWLPEHLGAVGNSLLKLIEEPPDNTHIIMVTEQPERILATILSRVQITVIRPYTDDSVKQILLNQGIEPSAAQSAAYLSGGDVNAAMKLLNEAELTFNPMSHFRDWMRLCVQYKVPELMQWTDSTASLGRENIKAFLTYCLRLIRETMAVKLVENYEVRLETETAEFVRNFSRAVQISNIETLYFLVNKTIGEIERNANAKMVLLDQSLQLGRAFAESRRAKTN